MASDTESIFLNATLQGVISESYGKLEKRLEGLDKRFPGGKWELTVVLKGAEAVEQKLDALLAKQSRLNAGAASPTANPSTRKQDIKSEIAELEKLHQKRKQAYDDTREEAGRYKLGLGFSPTKSEFTKAAGFDKLVKQREAELKETSQKIQRLQAEEKQLSKGTASGAAAVAGRVAGVAQVEKNVTKAAGDSSGALKAQDQVMKAKAETAVALSQRLKALSGVEDDTTKKAAANSAARKKAANQETEAIISQGEAAVFLGQAVKETQKVDERAQPKGPVTTTFERDGVSTTFGPKGGVQVRDLRDKRTAQDIADREYAAKRERDLMRRRESLQRIAAEYEQQAERVGPGTTEGARLISKSRRAGVAAEATESQRIALLRKQTQRDLNQAVREAETAAKAEESTNRRLSEIAGRRAELRDRLRTSAANAKQFADAAGNVTSSARTERADGTVRQASVKTLVDGSQIKLLEEFNRYGQRTAGTLSQLAAAGKPASGVFEQLGKYTLYAAKNVATYALAGAAIGTVTAAFGLSAKQALLVESRTARLSAVFRGSREEAKLLAQDVVSLGASLGQSASDSLDAATRFARLGLTRRQVIEGTRVALVASTVAEIDSATAAEQLTAIMATYRLQVSDLTTVLGGLNAISNTYNVTTRDLLNGLARVSGVAAQAGLGLNETMGLIAAGVGRTGRPGAEIGNALKSVVLNTSTPEKQATLLNQFGIDAKDANGELKNFAQLLGEIYVAYQKEGNAGKQTLIYLLAGKQQASRFTAILEGYPEALANAATAAQGLSSAERELALITETLGFKAAQTGQNFLVLGGNIAQAISEAGRFKEFLDGISSRLERQTLISRANDELVALGRQRNPEAFKQFNPLRPTDEQSAILRRLADERGGPIDASMSVEEIRKRVQGADIQGVERYVDALKESRGRAEAAGLAAKAGRALADTAGSVSASALSRNTGAFARAASLGDPERLTSLQREFEQLVKIGDIEGIITRSREIAAQLDQQFYRSGKDTLALVQAQSGEIDQQITKLQARGNLNDQEKERLRELISLKSAGENGIPGVDGEVEGDTSRAASIREKTGAATFEARVAAAKQLFDLLRGGTAGADAQVDIALQQERLRIAEEILATEKKANAEAVAKAEGELASAQKLKELKLPEQAPNQATSLLQSLLPPSLRTTDGSAAAAANEALAPLVDGAIEGAERRVAAAAKDTLEAAQARVREEREALALLQAQVEATRSQRGFIKQVEDARRQATTSFGLAGTGVFAGDRLASTLLSESGIRQGVRFGRIGANEALTSSTTAAGEVGTFANAVDRLANDPSNPDKRRFAIIEMAAAQARYNQLVQTQQTAEERLAEIAKEQNNFQSEKARILRDQTREASKQLAFASRDQQIQAAFATRLGGGKSLSAGVFSNLSEDTRRNLASLTPGLLPESANGAITDLNFKKQDLVDEASGLGASLAIVNPRIEEMGKAIEAAVDRMNKLFGNDGKAAPGAKDGPQVTFSPTANIQVEIAGNLALWADDIRSMVGTEVDRRLALLSPLQMSL